MIMCVHVIGIDKFSYSFENFDRHTGGFWNNDVYRPAACLFSCSLSLSLTHCFFRCMLLYHTFKHTTYTHTQAHIYTTHEQTRLGIAINDIRERQTMRRNDRFDDNGTIGTFTDHT